MNYPIIPIITFYIVQSMLSLHPKCLTHTRPTKIKIMEP